MKNKLYLECYSGISGDMMVASLLDLGADKDVLEKALQSLLVGGFQIKVSRVKKAGLDACDFDVVLDAKHENHDHDMDYLHGEGHHHGKEKHHDHDHEHSHENGHSHEHGHSHDHEGSHDHEHSHEESHDHHYSPNHEHHHRGLPDILTIINHAHISERAKTYATRIFEVLAKSEAKAHGVPLVEVHFHEVGAVDSIVDIIAVAVCLDNLDIDEVIVPVLYEGTGFVRCQHGVIPVPVPAVSNIVAAHGIKLHITKSVGEFVTPTGAAIVAAIRTADQLPEQFSIEKIGIGAGKRNYDRPSILRAMLIKEEHQNIEVNHSHTKHSHAKQSEAKGLEVKNSDRTWMELKETDVIYKLESNIDDSSGEALGYVMECLLEAGAKDVFYTPIYMKKNRPAYQLNVICKEEDIDVLEQIIFEETTTIGIRKQEMKRTILERELQKIQTSLGEVQVKVCMLPSGKRWYPEYRSVVELCKKHKMSYQEVYHLVLKEGKIEY